jgi:hypothetical protein
MNDFTFETNFWGNCANTYHEETKQFVYAKLMGLDVCDNSIDVKNKSIMDIGAGPVSLLLKTKNLKFGAAVDPLIYPKWIYERYSAAGLKYFITGGETIPLDTNYDECWIYNCLQHVEDPAKIISNARTIASTIRIFEWVDIPPHTGHPHELKKETLEKWLGVEGNVTNLGESGCFGKCFYGVFTVK